MGMRRCLLATLLGAVLIGGCGGDDDPVEGGAVGLTEWLPRDAVTYTAVDIAAYKEELDLPEDADPTSEPELERVALAPFSTLLVEPPIETVRPLESARSEEVLDAVEPEAVTAAATSQSEGADGAVVTAYGTTADEGEIGSRLGDLGYRDSRGVLEGGPGEPAIRLEEGLVFASDDPDALRQIPDEQRDDPPLELLGELDGEDLAAVRIDGACYSESGAATEVDGSAEIAVLVPGGGDPERMSGGEAVGEAESDGDLVVAPVDTGGSLVSARTLVMKFLPGYDCG